MQIEKKPDQILVMRSTPLATAQAIEKWWCGAEVGRRFFKRGKFWEETPTERGVAEWRVVEKDEIRAEVYSFLNLAFVDVGSGMVEPFSPMKRDVDQVMDALKAYLFDRDNVMEP